MTIQPASYKKFVVPIFVTIIIIMWLFANPKFEDMAFIPATENVEILDHEHKVVDNLFKSEYSWLIKVSDPSSQQWLLSQKDKPYDWIDDGKEGVPSYLIHKFERFDLDEKGSALKHLGEGRNGREHYLLLLKDNERAIYYIATI